MTLHQHAAPRIFPIWDHGICSEAWQAQATDMSSRQDQGRSVSAHPREPGLDRRREFSVMRRSSNTGRRLRAGRWMVAETVSRDLGLMAPMVKRRSAVILAGPWSVPMVPRSSSRLQSGM
jgi:hypothetical protein